MIRFLFKGLLRDKSRSLLPVIVVTVGVMMTVFLQAYLEGILTDSIEESARLTSGHVKITTRAYHDNSSQLPNEFAVTGSERLIEQLQLDYADMKWAERILFGGLLDVPDSSGMTRSQGNVAGAGIKLIGAKDEINRMDLQSKLISGHFPEKAGEVLISNELFKKMKLKLGDVVTLLSSSMYGDMAMYNFTVCGTLHFGIAALDKGMLYADIQDVRTALYMEDAAGEILGFFPESYDEKRALQLQERFKQDASPDNESEFDLVLTPMSKAEGMDFLIVYSNYAGFIIIFIFVFAMSIVLWNAGLLGGLRRYGEFGLRLAIGETKREAYRSLVGEAVLIGLVGSVTGTAIGLIFAYLMQVYGLDAGDMIKDSTLMLPTVFRAQITTMTYFIGFIPGVLSTVIGAMLAGIGIYKRQTAQLFKELT
jgi:putative ABC transport system permease protein